MSISHIHNSFMIYHIPLPGQHSSKYNVKVMHLLLNLQKSVTAGIFLCLLWQEGLLIKFPFPRLAVEIFLIQRSQEWRRPAKERANTSDQTMSLVSLTIWFLSNSPLFFSFIFWSNGLLLCFDFGKHWSSKSAVSGAHVLCHLQGFLYIDEKMRGFL